MTTQPGTAAEAPQTDPAVPVADLIRFLETGVVANGLACGTVAAAEATRQR
jgi:hypothetical protein